MILWGLMLHLFAFSIVELADIATHLPFQRFLHYFVGRMSFALLMGFPACCEKLYITQKANWSTVIVVHKLNLYTANCNLLLEPEYSLREDTTLYEKMTDLICANGVLNLLPPQLGLADQHLFLLFSCVIAMASASPSLEWSTSKSHQSFPTNCSRQT